MRPRLSHKNCSGCNQVLPRDAFRQRKTKINYLCKECEKKRLRTLDRRGRDRRRYLDIKNLVIKEKQKPCDDCGMEYPYYVMDFDHREGEKKKFAVAKGVYWTRNLKVMKEEIEKCDVVCANCHRIRTFKRKEASVCSDAPEAP